MAKFEVGNKLGGRKPGALNRSTEQAKLTIARLDNITEDFEKIRQQDPLEAAKLYLKLLEYIVPKKASMELSGQLDQRIHQISINVNRTGSEPRD